MAAVTIRIRATTHRALKELAARSGQSLQDMAEKAIDDYRRKLYLEGANADYSAMNADPRAFAEFKKEIGAWDVTNLDGLDNAY